MRVSIVRSSLRALNLVEKSPVFIFIVLFEITFESCNSKQRANAPAK